MSIQKDELDVLLHHMDHMFLRLMVFLHHRIVDFHDESMDFWGASHHGSEKERWMIPIQSNYSPRLLLPYLPTFTNNDSSEFCLGFHEVGTSRIRPYFEGISP